MAVIIDPVYCKGCELCLVVCKFEALTIGTERNAKGYLTPTINADKCTQCRNCEIICPEMTITVVAEK